MSIPLDQFELIETIGEGGMGVVWRGKHTVEDVTVAVKVLTSERAGDAKVRAAFRNEVRQAARLHHRNVITLFDQGEVSKQAATASYGDLTEGSPYLAMEYLPGGTLSGLRGPVTWELLRGLLFDILDALAHAHARGVIHRDLKPANVLLKQPAGVHHGVKLSDFGIAHAMDANLDTDDLGASISGTLRYMAPEQILGHWRDEGPWTDLYALGVLAYRLSSGAFPFGEADGEQLVHCHLHVPAPRVIGRMAVPLGFDAWVDRLLAKRPVNRFMNAADASYALDQLGPAVDRGGVPLSEAGEALERDTDTVDATPADPITQITATSGSIQVLLKTWDLGGESIAEPTARPRIPETWRRPVVRDLSIELVGAGLGLYGLRPVPMVARVQERDVLWENLRDASRHHTTRLVALYGTAGCGKSRIVQWISQRAAELGAARVLHATHSPIAGQADGLRPMLANLLRCVGLSRPEVVKRCDKFVNEHALVDDGNNEGLTIAELISPAADDVPDGERVRLATSADRYRAGRRLLERLSLRRPLMVWFDDVQWGSDTLGFAEFLLTSDHANPLPILIALTVREESLANRPWETEQLDLLLKRPETTRLDVQRMSTEDHKQLVGRMLGLASGLVDEVANRTDGNPLFAVQLIGDWVERGLLQTAADGFSLRPGARPELPDDLHQLWTDRVDHICGQFDAADEALSALQLAAALGQEVLYEEWHATCDIAGVAVPAQLLEQLWAFQLASASDQGWSFTHGMLRESLERRAREQDRWADHHRACARMLAKQYADTEPGIADRRGRHLVAAGDLAESLEPLLRGAEARRQASDFHLAYALFEERRAAMTKLGLADSDRRWADNDIRWARARVTQGHLVEATQLANAAEERAEQHGWTDLKAWAHSVHGAVALARGDIGACYEEYARGVALFRKVDDLRGLSECLTGLGGVCYWKRDLEEALRHYEEAYKLTADKGDLYELGIILRGMGNVRHLCGEVDASAKLLERSLSCFDHNGNRFNAASCMNDLGEIKRGRGDLDDAEALYQRSGQLYESLGCADASTPHFNLGLLRVQRKKYAAARNQFQAELIKMARAERTLDLLWVHAGMVPCMAADRDWDGFDYHLQKVYDLVEDFVDNDIAYLTELAGKLAGKSRQQVRAQQAYRIAIGQYKRMDNSDKVAELEQLVAG